MGTKVLVHRDEIYKGVVFKIKEVEKIKDVVLSELRSSDVTVSI